MNAESDRPVDVSILVPAPDCRAHADRPPHLGCRENPDCRDSLDCRANLDRCLTSLLVQRVSKEIIVVDGGSSGGIRALLDLYAAYHPSMIRVIEEDHRGTASRPRNRALAEAKGRYVFFCDAAGFVGPEALRRMVAMADRNGSGIVLGRIAAQPGDRSARPRDFPFHEDADRVTLGGALRGGAAYDVLTCFALFRRAMLERHRIRFDESLRTGEDMVFAAHAYCHAYCDAGVLSVVADQDCYHLPSRPRRDPLAFLRAVRTAMELMARHVPPGPLRDRLLLRHFKLDVFPELRAPFLAADEATREKIAIEVADLCSQWLTQGVLDRLDAADRLRAAAPRDLTRLVRLAGVQTASLRHRLTALEWDGDRLAVSGSIALTGFPGEAGLVLRERTSREERPAAVTSVADLFSVALEVTSLPAGVWDVHAAVHCEGVRRLARLGSERDPGVRPPPPRFASGVVVVPFLTRSHGNLSLDVGGRLLRVPGSVRLTRAEWAGRRLRVEGQVHVGDAPGAAAVRHLVWRERASGRERRAAVTATGPHTFTAETGGFDAGTWDAYLELDVGGPPARFPVKVGGPETLGRTMRWWRGLVRWTARPYATAVNRRLSTSVRAATPLTLLRRMFRQLRRR
ncbi:glycosyltransferase family 2 protein [Planotetraspora sp. GP83]|uniref:glycosyltransferase family 2 protein n=1 Tax=Planotetraspora sp. GP83 TaxID=3156264 RepID=UPI003512F774